MLDHVLAALLIVALPIRALCRDLRRTPPRAKLDRYRSTTLMIAALLALLGVDWVAASRRVGALGLDIPNTTPAIAALVITLVLIVVIVIMGLRRVGSADDRPRDVQATMLPGTPQERSAFLVFVLAAGIGWEVLYRGFLLFYLTPFVGPVSAVCVSAVAYAFAHGFGGAKLFAGSLVSALLFTIGYYATSSLWWLVVLHVALPLLGLAAADLGRGDRSRVGR